jgi:hypothetical protein
MTNTAAAEDQDPGDLLEETADGLLLMELYDDPPGGLAEYAADVWSGNFMNVTDDSIWHSPLGWRASFGMPRSTPVDSMRTCADQPHPAKVRSVKPTKLAKR